MSEPVEDASQISDGYHTFAELYDHRIELFLALCRVLKRQRRKSVWRSESHSDGTRFEGWFVLGFATEAGEQITYHLPMSRWEEAGFAETREGAPAYDGHTSADVLARLKRL